jgi:hypothetical protein
MTTVKSVGAVVAGFLIIAVLSTVTDKVLENGVSGEFRVLCWPKRSSASNSGIMKG